MKKLPIGLQNFKEIINENYLYVDKTDIIHKLITNGKCYFLSRPRRFGKSLIVSILHEIFSGNKELFKDLKIYNLDYDWKNHPVITLDFNKIDSKSGLEVFKNNLLDYVYEIAKQNNINIGINNIPSQAFSHLISELSKIDKVVILIDEYDMAILNNITEPKEAIEMRSALQSFFKIIKAAEAEGQIKFIFVTGVTRFAKTSLFSGFNNLNDISLDEEYSIICGITKDELNNNFQEYIKSAKEKIINKNENNVKYAEQNFLDEIKKYYNGYRFSDSLVEKVYNPFSILLFLEKKKFDNYWFKSGTPTFLIQLLEINKYQFAEENQAIEMSSIHLDSIDINEKNGFEFLSEKREYEKFASLLFQAGYLTIESFDYGSKVFTLNYPNYEVKSSFFQHIITEAYTVNSSLVDINIYAMYKAIQKFDFKTFFESLNNFISELPYAIKEKPLEKYYHNAICMMFKIFRLDFEVEVPTGHGRLDIAIRINNNVFVFELKVNQTAKIALDQIIDKKYCDKYMNLNYNKIFAIGVNFNTDPNILKEDKMSFEDREMK